MENEYRFGVQLKEAIERQQQKRERKAYDTCLSLIREGNFDSEKRLEYIEGFRYCVSVLDKEQETLVGVILKMDWCECEDEIVTSYVNFLTELLSAHTFYLRGCLRMLIQKFTPALKGNAELDSFVLESMDKQFSNVHKAMISILNIVPTAPRHLLIKLSDMFPYVGRHQIFTQSYVKNLLLIATYMPTLQEKLFEIIIDNLLKIDVQILKCDIEDEVNSDEDDEDDLMQFDVEIDKENIHNTVDHKHQDVEMRNESARKLDNLMVTVFEFIQKQCFHSGIVDWKKAELLYNDLMQVFEVVLLPTHASAFVQFVIFYICSLDQYFVNSFLEFCWQKVCNPNVAIVLRQTAVAYIGSLVARAKFIKGDVVETCLTLFSDWIHGYLNLLDSGVYPDIHKHATFYSVCQTLLYVFVFRHKCVLEQANWRAFVRKLGFEQIIGSRLNPLKFCLATVVDMFARITRMHEIVFCYTIIEHNKRSLVSTSFGNETRDKKNIFDSFFPFDPYLLKKSSKYVVPLYQEWTGIEGDDPPDEDEAVIMDDNENEGDAKKDSKLDALGLSYSVSPATPRFGWCISPGFHPELMKPAAIPEE
eukprot:gene12736-14041_t